MALDLTNENHRTALARENFWDLIWDDSSHVAVFEAPGLLEQIPGWLKPGGVYMSPIPSLSGMDEEDARESLAQQIVKRYEEEGPEISESFKTFVVQKLQGLGFSYVDVQLSPLLQAIKTFPAVCCGDISLKAYLENLEDEESLDVEKGQELQKAAALHLSEVIHIDPVFKEATLGKAYILARR